MSRAAARRSRARSVQRKKAAKRADAAKREDVTWMREALRLAARARGRTAPTPLVGSVVVRGGRRIASGYHTRLGAAHAEARALERAGAQARGATLYVTLEPCAHTGLQPPCVEAVLAARPGRVVVGMRDPDPRTAGRSLARMRRAGIEVTLGVCAEECRALNRGFVSRVERGIPFTTLKLASTLDGRIATVTGESRWITGPRARAHVHRLRGASDAICVGSGTLLADDPALTVRAEGRVVRRPVRVVIDSQLRTPPEARLLRGPDPERSWIVCTRAAPRQRRARLEATGARLLDVRARRGRVDLRAAWGRLGALGVNDLLVEGGGGLASALLAAGLVDRLLVYLSPRLIGSDGRPVIGSLGVRALDGALELPDLEVHRLGRDLLLQAEW